MVYLKRLLRLTIVLTAIVGVMTVSVAVVAPQVGELVGAHRSDHELLSLEPLAERSYIFDSQGNLQGTLINSRNENRVQVGLEDVPETVIGSVLAAEDESFYRHNGINVRSIGRAVDANLERQRQPRRLHHHPAGREELPRRRRPGPEPQDP